MKTFRMPRNCTRRLPRYPTNLNKMTSTEASSSLAFGLGVDTPILLQSKRSGSFYTSGAAGLQKCCIIGPFSEPCHILYSFRAQRGSQNLLLPGNMRITKSTSKESGNLYQNSYRIFQEISATERQSQRWRSQRRRMEPQRKASDSRHLVRILSFSSPQSYFR